MTTYCGTYQPSGFNFGKLILGFILLSGIVFGVHALKHSLSEVVRQCNDDNLKLTLYNPTTGRKAHVCQPDTSKDQWGRMITEVENGQEKEVTSFMGQEWRKNTLSKVVTNLNNQGYSEILYIAEELKDAVIIILSVP